jgi:hypothetical protein
MTNTRSRDGIMHVSRLALGLAAATALAVTHIAPMSATLSQPTNVPGIDKPVIVATGDVDVNETWTANNYYVLRGAVFVRSGSTLNIQAGTRIVGESGSVGTLIVERGGRLNAIGTADAPIVFTSDQPIGQRGRGDWGGLIINGRARLNFGSGEAAGEGDTGVYGGTDDNDNSGILRYVRVEFGGIEFSPDNELNGIAFQAVGRGTQVDHVQSHLSRDDAMEWFGGSVDGKYLVMSGAADDSVDWTFGWSGRLQFVAVLQRGDDADNGIEADNNEFNNEVLPRSNPQIYNITLCGDPAGIASEVQRASNLRRGTAFTIRNFLITGFRTGFQISDNSTLAQVNNGVSQMGAGVSWNNLTNMHSSVTPFITSGRFPGIQVGPAAGLSAAACNASIVNPNLQPPLASLAGGQLAPIQPPNDGFFDAVTFIGAVPPAPAPNWMAGWTSFPQN